MTHEEALATIERIQKRIDEGAKYHATSVTLAADVVTKLRKERDEARNNLDLMVIAHGKLEDETLALLESNEYPCPGEHYSRQLTYEEQQMYEDDSVLPDGVTYIVEGDCKETITIDLEYESDDMGGTLVSYPVADGPCVPALHYDDEPLYGSPLFERYRERNRLRREFSTIRHKYTWGAVLQTIADLKRGKQ